MLHFHKLLVPDSGHIRLGMFLQLSTGYLNRRYTTVTPTLITPSTDLSWKAETTMSRII